MGVMQMGGRGCAGSTALPGRVCDRGGCVLMGVKVSAVLNSGLSHSPDAVFWKGRDSVWMSRGWCVWVWVVDGVWVGFVVGWPCVL